MIVSVKKGFKTGHEWAGPPEDEVLGADDAGAGVAGPEGFDGNTGKKYVLSCFIITEVKLVTEDYQC